MVSKENYKNLPNVIFTTLLIEKSPQAIPLGAACVASAVKNHKKTKDLCKTALLVFNKEDKSFINNSQTDDKAASYIAQEILKEKPAICGFSIFVWNKSILEKTAKILKENGVICIAGGPEVTAHPEVFADFDYTVCGQGEAKVPRLIWKILAKNLTPPPATSESAKN